MLNTVDFIRGRNEFLVAADGQEYMDLITGFGAVLLGHCHQPIIDGVGQQLQAIWQTGRLRTPINEEAANLVTSSLGQPYKHLQFYSTGNEAIEFAIRMANHATRRKAVVGFERSMHGKSVAASALCWQNDFFDLKNVHTLPFVDTSPESEILDRLRQTLSSRKVAAVFIELIQGSNGGHEASPEFYRAVCDICREYETLCVVDEVLTGFYRSGHLSYSREVGITPDILIFGKAMGNGFPVSAVVSHADFEITDAMLPGSTFSNNPLVASAVVATLTEMQRLDMSNLLQQVDQAVRAELSPLGEHGINLRGSGALWALELPDTRSSLAVQAAALSAHIVLAVNGRFIRLFPPATIASENLRVALQAVKKACLETAGA